MTFPLEILLAGACLWAAWRERRGTVSRETTPPRRYPLVWLTLAVVLLTLAIHEKTGVLNRITNMARFDSQTEGWYAERRAFQMKVITLVPPAAVAIGVCGLILVRKAWLRYLPTLCAVLYLVGFTAIQLVSFHYVDRLLSETRAGRPLREWASLLGLGLVCLSLAWAWVLDWWGAKRAGEHRKARRTT